jgi:hypothetical protein
MPTHSDWVEYEDSVVQKPEDHFPMTNNKPKLQLEYFLEWKCIISTLNVEFAKMGWVHWEAVLETAVIIRKSNITMKFE